MICLPKQYLKTIVEIFGLPKGTTAENYFYYWSEWQTEYNWHPFKVVFEFENFKLYHQGLIPLSQYTVYEDGGESVKYEFDLGLN